MIRRLIFVLTVVAGVFSGVASAGAVVIDPAKTSSTPVEYKTSEDGSYVGVALAPGTRGNLPNAEIPEVTTTGKCNDLIPADLIRPKMPESGLCWHEGPVMHGNETFALVWDPLRQSFATTKEYVEQFLKDVADGSGTLTSPYAVTSQYTDKSGRAANASLYGGACEDFGVHGGSACSFSSSSEPLRPGHEYAPEEGCPATGTNDFYRPEPRPEPSPEIEEGPNHVCLTDAQLKSEITSMVEQTGIIGRTQPGYTPLLVLLTPTGVETCLYAAGKLCSANGSLTPPPPKISAKGIGGTIEEGEYQIEITYVTAAGEGLPTVPETVTTSGSTSTIKIESPPAAYGATGWYAYVTQPNGEIFARQQSLPMAIGEPFTLTAPPATGPEPEPNPYFCSYHAQVNVGGTKVDYVVQPWTAMTACDEPEAPVITVGKAFEPKALETQLGEQLVSPLSQSHIAAVVNPEMNGWFALDGSEIDDNGCRPLEEGLDAVTVAGKGYLLRREFNNGWLLNSDPYVFRCAPSVRLEPKFVVPSPIDAGKVVAFDGSVSPSTLVVPAAGYAWEFGDGTKGTGPSVEHTYAQGGSYPVKLTLTDRGGYVESVTQTINVIGPPINTGLPAITDLTSRGSSVTEGDSLEASTGAWSGYPTPFTYAYQWQRCNGAGESCTAISGATGATYTPVGADVGHTLRVVVAASNAPGTGTATSAQTAVVAIHPVTPSPSGASGLVSAPPATPNLIAAVSGGAGPQEFTLTALLTPESRKVLLRYGVALRAGANEPADGVASILISAGEARHAHIYFKRAQSRVVVGRGTIKGLSAGAGAYHLRLSKKVMARLRRLHRVVLTVELLAIDKSGQRRIVTVAGRY